MHELSMADAMVKTIIDVAEKNDAEKILEVNIELGKLTLLNPEQLKFVLEVISKDTLLNGSKFEIEVIPIKVKCNVCNYVGSIDTDALDHFAPIIKCPKCEGDVTIISGRECNIKNIKIEKGE